MTTPTEFRNAALSDWADLFEPEVGGNGAQDAAYTDASRVPLRFAALSHGSKIADINYRISNSTADVTNLWAGKGTVGYLVTSPTYLWQGFSNNIQTNYPQDYAGDIVYNISAHGIQSWHFGNGTVSYSGYGGYGASSVSVVPGTGAQVWINSRGEGDTLSGYLQVNILNDGTWNITVYGTNGDLDLSSDGAINNPNPAKIVASGNWAKSPAAGIGTDYNFAATFNNQQHYGYWANGGNSGSGAGAWQYMNPGFSQDLNGAGVTENVTGTAMTTTSWNGSTSIGASSSGNLASGASFTYNFTHTAQGALYAGNGSPGGDARGRDWIYHRLSSIDLSITLSSVGGANTITGNINLCAALDWQDWSAKVAPGGTGTAGSGGGCVGVTMFLLPGLLAGMASRGRIIDGSMYNPDGITPREITDIRFMLQPCLRLVTVSGIEVTASTTTPMTMPDGSAKMFPEMLGELVLVDDDGDIRWEHVAVLEDVGEQMVALISMNDQNYFAGTVANRRVATHNVIAVK